MKIKIPKPYLFIGTIITTGIIVTITYNIIVANNINNSNQLQQVSQNDYSIEIAELQQRLTKAEEEIETLKEKSDTLESDNKEKDKTIQTLQTKFKVSTNNNFEKDLTATKEKLNNVENKVNKNENKNQTQEQLIKEKAELEKEHKIYSDRVDERSKLVKEKSQLLSNKRQLEEQIMVINASIKYLNVDEAKEQIDEWNIKANLATNEKEKAKYLKAIEELEKDIIAYQKVEKESTDLKKQLSELEKTIQEKNLDEQINKLTLSEEENKRYKEINSKIGKIKEELLNY